MINDQYGDYMKKYIIKIRETLSKEFVIEAKNKEDALDEIKYLYKNEDIVLYPEQCDIETSFGIEKEGSFSN